MQIYLVGGAVRDCLLGLPVADKDWLVVGATPKQMLKLGFHPVGKDFPVFLHPKTQEEYALARTERKDGHGYNGFQIYAAPEVTVEQDLMRRDLTINAIAVELDASGNWQKIIDPFNGQADITNRCLRHVSPAFSEDPLRILRVARFAARYTDFHIASETYQLMRQMVQAGEVKHLVAERTLAEFSKGLITDKPWIMLDVLSEIDALTEIWPQLAMFYQVKHQRQLLIKIWQNCVKNNFHLEVRYACLCWLLFSATKHDKKLNKSAFQQMAQHLRLPKQTIELTICLLDLQPALDELLKQNTSNAQSIMQFFVLSDAIRRPQRFDDLMDCCLALAEIFSNNSMKLPELIEQLKSLLKQLLAFPVANIAQQAAADGLTGIEVGEQILQARTKFVQQLLQQATPFYSS